MRGVPVFLLLLAPALAGEDDEAVPVGDAITLELCDQVRDALVPRIEEQLRLRFHRTVPMRVQPLALWRNRARGLVVASVAPYGSAFYDSSTDTVTIVPWVIGGDPNGPRVERKTRAAWRADLEPVAADVLTRALLHRNLPFDARRWHATLETDLAPDEAERCAADFLVTEGVVRYLVHRTCPGAAAPREERADPAALLRAYRPGGKEPYRIKLIVDGGRDGLDLAHRLALGSGMRGLRGVLYRPPPLALLVRPELLASVDFDEPPDPHSIFAFLAPDAKVKVHLAMDPLRADFFGSSNERREGCLVGYAAAAGSSRYAFWVSDPDDPGTWREEQAAALRGGAGEREVDMRGGATVEVLIRAIPLEGAAVVRGDAGGLVVLAREATPAANLEQRVVTALRALWLKKPKPALYAEALAEIE